MSVFLEQIEIENFKSYRGRHNISLSQQFTAIVGPNGSGKSNLMDAISFALAEETSSLRVKKLSDLIHGASVNNPTAQAASVKLSFRLHDSTETWFRRVIRGSSTAYMINGENVSAETYSSCLEKLGINVKAKNFLVFQGKVESVALKNPKERAQLFEEFSGSLILKEEYDRRKEELAKAQEDIKIALQQKKNAAAERSGSKREVEVAEDYQVLKNKLADQQVLLALVQLYYGERETECLNHQLQEASQELIELEGKKVVLDEQLKSKKKDRNVIQGELDAVDETMSVLENQMNQKLPSLIKAKEKVSLLTKKLSLAEKSLAQAVKADQERIKEIDQLEEALTAARNVVAAQKEAASTSVYSSLTEEQIKEYHRLKEITTRRSAADVEDLESLEREQNRDRNQLDNLLRIQSEARCKLEIKRKELSEAEKRTELLKENIRSIDAALHEERSLESDLLRKTESSKKAAENLRGKLADIERSLQEASFDHTESSKITRKQKTVTDLAATFCGIVGRVANLVKPVHQRYQLAVTKVIGKYMDAIVTDTEETARHCIQYLKTHMIEPESFLPLNYIKPKPLKERLRDNHGPGTFKLLFDVLKFDPAKLEPVVLFITQNVVVCETREDAMNVAWNRGTGERHDAVALDGTFYRKSGLVSGGSKDLENRSARWTEHQLTALQRVKDKLTSELHEALIGVRKEDQLFASSSQITVLEHRRQYAITDVENTGRLAEKLRNEIKELGQELENAEKDVQELRLIIATRQETMVEVQDRLNEAEDAVFGSFCREIGLVNIREYEENEPRVRRGHSAKLAEMEFQEKRILNQLEFQKSRDTSYNVQRWEKNVKKDHLDLQHARAELENCSQVETLKKQLDELKAKKLAVKKDADSLDEDLAKARQETTKTSRAIQALKEKILNLKSKIHQRKGERHAILKQFERDHIELPKLASSGGTDFTSSGSSSSQWTPSTASGSTPTQFLLERDERVVIDYSGMPESYKNLEGPEDIQRLVERLSTRCEEFSRSIEQLQGVNLNAPQRYAKLCQKVSEVNGEFERCRTKANKIQEAFNEVKKERQLLFMQCFNHVAENINAIYKALARHPSAIALVTATVPEEPYLGAIDFCCIVPGRSCCPLASLSGGQKTVASLALLFAMRTFKPAPFFVLDEIDAALDKINIGKVAAYLSEQAVSNHLQSIAISLKEEFYGCAHSLVGIVPEPAECLISKVFQLALEDYPLQLDEADTANDSVPLV